MKIICIGCNYAEHVAEVTDGEKPLFDATERVDRPMFFVKPDTALLRNNDAFFIPSFSQEIDYECELVVKITRVTKCIEQRFARRCYDDVGLGIDFTARDIQRETVAKGLPWELCKGFDHSAAISPKFISLDALGGDVQNLRFEMMLNGEVRQSVSTAEMLFSVDEIISYVSQFMTLKIGDLIFTGTPVGVGRIAAGDNITATLNGERLLDFDIK